MFLFFVEHQGNPMTPPLPVFTIDIGGSAMSCVPDGSEPRFLLMFTTEKSANDFINADKSCSSHGVAVVRHNTKPSLLEFLVANKSAIPYFTLNPAVGERFTSSGSIGELVSVLQSELFK